MDSAALLLPFGMNNGSVLEVLAKIWDIFKKNHNEALQPPQNIALK